MDKLDITPAEYEVMRVVWAEEETSSRHISQVLEADQGWKTGTTKSLINRLKNKGYLQARDTGPRHLYSATVTEQDSIARRIGQVFDDVCNTSEGAVVRDIIQAAELSQADIQDLRQLLDEKAKTAPDQVVCSCAPGQCSHHRYISAESEG